LILIYLLYFKLTICQKSEIESYEKQTHKALKDLNNVWLGNNRDYLTGEKVLLNRHREGERGGGEGGGRGGRGSGGRRGRGGRGGEGEERERGEEGEREEGESPLFNYRTPFLCSHFLFHRYLLLIYQPYASLLS
jgi:hypothetical protein